jgi:hypothetical protein
VVLTIQFGLETRKPGCRCGRAFFVSIFILAVLAKLSANEARARESANWLANPRIMDNQLVIVWARPGRDYAALEGIKACCTAF